MDSGEQSVVSLAGGMHMADPTAWGSLAHHRPQVAVTAPLEHSDYVPRMTEVGGNSLYLVIILPECSACH